MDVKLVYDDESESDGGERRMKTVHVMFTEEEHQQLLDIKGDRNWRHAIISEFGFVSSELEAEMADDE
jgi:hypothetical protein